MRLEKAQIVQLLTLRGDPVLARRAEDDELGGGDHSPVGDQT